MQEGPRCVFASQRTVVGVEGPDGKLSQWPARIVAMDVSHDLAVLQIDAPPDTLQQIKVPNLSPYHS